MTNGVSTAGQRIRSVTTRGVMVPLKFTLGTSAAVVRAVPLLLVDLLNEDGVTGKAYTFCYRPSGATAISSHLYEAVELLKGKNATPFEASQTLARQFALLGVTGAVRMALSLLDMAMWDATAQMHRAPLSTLLGSGPKSLRAYDSRGLGLMEPDSLAQEVRALLESGLGAVKVRLGYPTLFEDLAALRAVRKSVSGADIAIMVDYNQALTPAEAVLRGRELEKEGIYWLEEPIAHDDYVASAALARELKVPVQIGENLNGPDALLRAVTTGASDYVMVDVARIGGVTGWLHAAGIAAAQGIEMSSHLMPEVSTHLLCATPTAHWLEYVDWADAIVEEPLKIRDGMVLTPESAGSGISWDEAKLKRLAAI
ncbi:mandelate racemase [Bradyrhizobium sp. 186]|uniref:enolase C-terminal domain-like protein n=1 Tax=Bradyrhizobium sp. 186 TaxID=2782654 RepID=UPI002000B9EC|nr:enolase C-terminal domain-like protein [Bradyrhizobium sp. 186]UPK37194.1 mandelate racemase [Bradyrhizobium sp. 186]